MDINRVTETRGTVIPFPRTEAVKVHCRQPGCPFVASARTEGRAIKALAGHICAAHWPTWNKQPKGAA